jgi:hypothetical protein
LLSVPGAFVPSDGLGRTHPGRVLAGSTSFPWTGQKLFRKQRGMNAGSPTPPLRINRIAGFALNKALRSCLPGNQAAFSRLIHRNCGQLHPACPPKSGRPPLPWKATGGVSPNGESASKSTQTLFRDACLRKKERQDWSCLSHHSNVSNYGLRRVLSSLPSVRFPGRSPVQSTSN